MRPDEAAQDKLEFRRPEVLRHGSVSDLTQTGPGPGGGGDGGIPPNVSS